METLTYPYGETPEEVIRERWSHLLAFEPNPDDHVTQMVVAFPSSDDLLTVLDALLVASELPLVKEGPLKHFNGRDKARQLRISILAALGIEEGDDRLRVVAGMAVLEDTQESAEYVGQWQPAVELSDGTVSVPMGAPYFDTEEEATAKAGNIIWRDGGLIYAGQE